MPQVTGNGQRKTFFQGQGREKSGNFISTEGKLIFWTKVREHWNKNQLIQYHWRLEDTFGVTVIWTLFLLNEEGNFVEKYDSQWTTGRRGCSKPDILHFPWFEKFYSVGKSQAILKSDVCGNHKGVRIIWGEGRGWCTQARGDSVFQFFVDPCELACISSGLVLTWHGLVADGNRCTNRPDIFDVCIAGQCRVRKNKVVLKEIRLALNTLVSFIGILWDVEQLRRRLLIRVPFVELNIWCPVLLILSSKAMSSPRFT